MRRIAMLILIVVGLAPAAIAQEFPEEFHIFPQFVDGRFPDGYYYRSTLMITPWFSSDAPVCSLNLRGMTAQFEGTANTSVFSISISPGQFSLARTTGTQGIQTGYATLTCNESVWASLLYAYYSPSGIKLSEATVFSSQNQYTNTLMFDHREGALLGIAIANDSDLTRTYTLTVTGSFGTRIGTVAVAPRRNISRFLTDLVSSIPAGSFGLVRIETSDLADAAVIGFRVTGVAFTTIPATRRFSF